MRSLSGRLLRSLVVTGVVGLCLSVASQASAAVFVDDTPVTGWGVNGTVFATVIVGDTVVVGGKFTQAISPTNVRVDRLNLAAFSLSTGDLLTSWRADADDVVKALGTNGTDVWAGGSFLNVGGVSRYRLAKLDAASGAVDPGFAPVINSGVKAIELEGADLYIGGGFGTVNGHKHGHVAKLAANTGAPDEQFQANANLAVYGLAKSPVASTLYVSGLFDTLDGTAQLGVGGVDSNTGATSGPVFDHTDVPIYGLDMSPDGSTLFGAQKSNQGSAWRVSTGTRIWHVGTDGNVQCVKFFSGTVYFGFHDGYQHDTTIKLLAVDPTSGAVDLSFHPTINSFMGVHSIDASPGGLVIGGAFTVVSGVSSARHLAIFHP